MFDNRYRSIIDDLRFVDDNTIRVELNTTTLLSIIDSSEDVIMARAAGNNNVIFTAPLNGSRCIDDNEDGQLSTTLYIIQMIIIAISSFACKDLHMHHIRNTDCDTLH